MKDLEKIRDIADRLYPIVPLETRDGAGEILDDGKMLENYRLTIQSVAGNMAYVRGFIDGQTDGAGMLRRLFRRLFRRPDHK